MNNENNTTTEEVVLEDNQIICALTDAIRPAKSKEQTLQSLIAMLNEEYGFEMSDMERDFSFTYIDSDGKTKRTKIDLAVFDAGKPHDADGLIRICIVNDDKTKSKDSKKGVEATLQAIIDVDASEFKNPPSMIEAIRYYCKKTGQKVPETMSEFMRCIVDSLASKYNLVFQNIEHCTGKKIDRLHIIGGGSQNNLLNQLTADILNVEVIAGSVEATALGNIMVQAIAKGEIKSIGEARNIIEQSSNLLIFKLKAYKMV